MGQNKAGRNNGVVVIWGHCGVIVNVEQKRLNEHEMQSEPIYRKIRKQTQISQNNENLLMKTCSYGVIGSMICNIQSIAEFVAVMRGKITKKIGARGTQNLAVLRGGRLKGVFIQEIKCDFVGPKRGGRINGVAVRRGSTVFRFKVLILKW